MNSTFSWYSPGYYYFLVVTLIRSFSGTRPDNFSILAWILPFPGTRPDSIIFRYSQLFDPFLEIAGTVFRYSHRFYLFPVVSLILLFFGTHTDSTLFRYSSRQFFDTRMDSTFSRYSPRLYYFSVLTLIRHFFGNHRDSFSILARILLFPGTLPETTIFRSSHDSTIFRYSSGQFFDTRTNSPFSRHLPGFFHFSVLTLIRPFFGNHRESFSMLA